MPYTKITNFTAKDSLLSGNPSKLVRGSEFDAEFTSIETTFTEKADKNAPTLVNPVLGNATATSMAVSGLLSGNALALGVQSIATSGGTTTFTASSPFYTVFTGVQNQTLVLPNATTLLAGKKYNIDNDSTQTITVNANGGGAFWIMAPGTDLYLTLLDNTTSAGTWEKDYSAAKLANGKSLTTNNTLILSGTDGSTLNIGTGGTLGSAAYTPDTGSGAITTVGALNAGSITSGFGAIDVGTDAISGGALTSGNSGTPGNFLTGYSSNTASRSWKIANDVSTYGDWKLQVSTTQTGTTYQDVLSYTVAGGLAVTGSISGNDWIKLNAQNTLYSSSGVGFFLQAPDVSTTPLTIRGNSGATWATVSATGLAVTGALSTTGALTTAGLKEDTSGNLGLGVTPSGWTSGVKAVQLPNGTSLSSHASVPYTYLGSNTYRTTGGATDTYVVSGQGATAYALGGYDGKHSWYTAPSGTAGNPITFTQAMTLDASGNLLVGATAVPSSTISGVAIRNPVAVGASIFSSGSTNTATLVSFINNNGSVGRIDVSGSATTYATSSDYRLKDVIGPVQNSGSFIDALEPVRFKWKADGTLTDGFLAHKFQEVSPSSVSGTKDEVDEDGNPKYQAMQASSSEVMANIIAELQSLRKRVKELEAR